MKACKHLLTLIAGIFITNAVSAQLPFNLKDERQSKYCAACNDVLQQKPKEILFGIQVNEDGDVYFVMSSLEWFNKIFKNDSYGVAVDLVSKDRYACNRQLAEDAPYLPKGTMLFPVYRKDLLKGLDKTVDGQIFTKVGKLPAALKNKEIEGNLVIVNGNLICWYTNFINIDRSVWGLLPMGLFTDSLVQTADANTGVDSAFFTYSKTVQLRIPFAKATADFNNAYFKKFYDSIGLSGFNIRKIEVRAYSSVEGPEKTNRDLMNRRADSIIYAIKKYEPALTRIKTLTAENWPEFFRDIADSKYADLKDRSKAEIKQKLADKKALADLEPILSSERKAVVNFYLEPRSAYAGDGKEVVVSKLTGALKEKDLTKAREMQKELAERIIDKRLPVDYITKVEVPASKEFSALLNDREVYKYLLKATSEYEALNNFLALQKLDPANGRIRYNICALRFFMWQYGGDSSSRKLLLKEINALPGFGIDSILTKRMIINYHILKSQEDQLHFDFAGKDRSVEAIRDIYAGIKNLRDDEIYSVAKYFAYYAQTDWALEAVLPRIDKIDVSEDIVFFYLNLMFFQTGEFGSDEFQQAMLNAINLNPKRFCNFFRPSDRGGASMQLLEYDEIKAKYCEVCK